MKKLVLMSVAGVLMALTSCTPKLGYFQDLQAGSEYNLQQPRVVKAEQGDKMSIIVSSRSPQLASLFNLPIVSNYTASSSDMPVSSTRMSAYTVGEMGDIVFPVLGSISVKGLTREQIQEKIRRELSDRDLLKDATVTANFLDLTYSVMGDVKLPGRYAFDHDYVTLLEALSRAGDLTITGRRDNILVTRNEGGKQTNYRIDLTNSNELYQSPAFYLKQNDIIYVEPNVKKARESTSTGNALSSPSLWLSTASFITSLCVLIFK